MSKTDSAPFSYEGLDRVIHEKARLGLLTSLMAHPKGLAFADLKQLCGLTDGNLSRHLAVLQEAGLVEVTKGYEGNRPHTTCRLTRSGRRRFLDYLAVLERLVRDAKAAGREAPPLGRLGNLVVVRKRVGQAAAAFDPAMVAVLDAMVRIALPFGFADARAGRLRAVGNTGGNLEERVVTAVLEVVVCLGGGRRQQQGHNKTAQSNHYGGLLARTRRRLEQCCQA